MALDLNKLRAEIDADPETRGYSGMSNKEVADDLNTAYREGEASGSAIRNYLSLETSRTNNGGDTVAVHIVARLCFVADLTPTADNSTQPDPLSGLNNITNKEIAACVALKALAVDNEFSLAFSDVRFDGILQDVKDGNVMKPADVTAIKALTLNLVTRAGELQFGFVREGNVKTARAI